MKDRSSTSRFVARRDPPSNAGIVRSSLLFLMGVTVLLSAGAQPPPAEPVPAGTLRLSTQGEIPLTDFIDYVGKRLGMRFIYDKAVRQKKVNLVAPDPIPVESLNELLQTVLINEGLVLTESDRQGFMRISPNDQIPRLARPSARGEDLGGIASAVPITRVFLLDAAQPSRITELIGPVLSQPGGRSIPMDRSQLLLVTDVAANVRQVERLIEVLDGETAQVEIEFVRARSVAVEDLAAQLGEILGARRRAMGRGGDGSGTQDTGAIEISIDARTSSLILIGTSAEILQAKNVLAKLDQPLDTRQRSFSLRYFSAERFDEIIRETIQGSGVRPPYQSRVEGSVLIVDSTPEVFDLIERTQRQVDTREAPDAQSPVRFYKIKNVPAQELLETISGINGSVGDQSGRPATPNRRRTSNDAAVNGPNLSPLDFPGAAQPIQNPLIPPALRDRVGNVDRLADDNDPATGDGFSAGFPNDLVDSDSEGESAIDQLGAAQVAVDLHTNTIIVVAPPEVQRIYAKLIETLDQRRPQVLIEAQVVIVDTSDDYTLGVEISGGDRTGASRLFSFSSFGLSTVDPVTGSLGILPGVGFNGTLVDPDTADVVVQALTTHSRARVLSTPRILVNDNSEGQLTSVLEVPFTSVNASQTVATTSFAGFAEAGTTINVTPTISDDNYLQVDYVVTLNSFTGTGADGVPPPRQTNEVRSRVTVPDGHTVIVGGLTSKNEAYEIDSIPWVERIPVIRNLVSLQSESWMQTSLFVFLKPIILREDKFKDLRFLSEMPLRESGSEAQYPDNDPLLIE